jgi:hypothetical protein
VAEQLCCPKGHRWKPVFAPDQWPPDFRSSCPVCGEAPLGPFDMTITMGRMLTVLAVMCLVTGPALLTAYMLILPARPDALFIWLLLVAMLLPLAAGLILVGIMAVWVVRRRVKKMAEIAEAMNFTFAPRLVTSSVRTIAPFGLFKLGRSPKTYNGMQSRVGDCHVLLFEYCYMMGAGQHEHFERHTAVILFDGAAGVPYFQLTPRTVFDKLAGLFTTKGIELKDASEFNRRFKLTGPDEDGLRKTFHPDLVEYLGRNGHWHIEVLNGHLLLYRQTRLKPDKCPGMVTDALEVRDLLRGPQQSNL